MIITILNAMVLIYPTMLLFTDKDIILCITLCVFISTVWLAPSQEIYIRLYDYKTKSLLCSRAAGVVRVTRFFFYRRPLPPTNNGCTKLLQQSELSRPQILLSFVFIGEKPSDHPNDATLQPGSFRKFLLCPKRDGGAAAGLLRRVYFWGATF